MAKYKNTAAGGKGIGVGGRNFECGPGEVIDIPDALVEKAKEDPTNAALFGEGGFVPVGAAKPAKAEETKPAK